MKTKLWISFEFEGWHRWKDAPAEHAYLAARHRHLFKCRAEFVVSHNDREFEFIAKKREAIQTAQILQQTEDDCEEWSCEEWATRLLLSLDASEVEVSEDGENGAKVVA